MVVASLYFLIFLGAIRIEGHRFTLCETQLVLWSTQPSCWHSAKAVEEEEEQEEEEEEEEEEVSLEREGDNFRY